MKEPAGYRVLARRLARDVRALLNADAAVRISGMDGREYQRRLNRASKTLARFTQYEQSHLSASTDAARPEE